MMYIITEWGLLSNQFGEMEEATTNLI